MRGQYKPPARPPAAIGQGAPSSLGSAMPSRRAGPSVPCWIAPMVAGDVAQVLEIEQRSQRAPWPEKLFVEELDRAWAYIDVVRTRDGSGDTPIVAFCNYWLVRDEVHLLNLATHPDWRRHGIGTLLMGHLLAFAGRRDCRYVTLEVRKSNSAARSLYRAHGFEAVGLRPRYYAEDGEDAVVMTLELHG